MWQRVLQLNGVGCSESIVVKPLSDCNLIDLYTITNGYYNGNVSIDTIKSYWNIGDVITLNSTVYELLDFEHDTLTINIKGKEKALITLGSVSSVMTRYMNTTASNAGGWKSCDMRTYLNNTYYNSLPAEVQLIIKSVEKYTSAGSKSETIETTNDKIFLASEYEVGASTTLSYKEGEQYERYKTFASRTKNNVWWLRSPLKDYPSGFSACLANGYIQDNGKLGANESYGIVPLLCI